MGKILIIGVGSAGVNTVKHMREVGIPNAEYMSGLESLHSGATAENWKECAELAKDGISEITESYIKEKS